MFCRTKLIEEHAAENSCLQKKLDRSLREVQEMNQRMHEKTERDEANRLNLEGAEPSILNTQYLFVCLLIFY